MLLAGKSFKTTVLYVGNPVTFFISEKPLDSSFRWSDGLTNQN